MHVSEYRLYLTNIVEKMRILQHFYFVIVTLKSAKTFYAVYYVEELDVD